MRNLVVFKQEDETPYHVDLDDETAIGVNVELFNPMKPNVSKLNSSNEFTIPKTRNNLSIFDVILNQSQRAKENFDYNYDCEYFIDNHIIISGKVFLSGADEKRISLFIVDKDDIVSKLRSYSFYDFEKEYILLKYYSFSDWAEEKRTFGGETYDLTNCFPNRYNVRPYISMASDLWKEAQVSFVQGDINVNFDSWKTKMLSFLDSIDPAYQYKVFWNACLNKWTMDIMNFITPFDRIRSSQTPSTRESAYAESYALNTVNSNVQLVTNEFVFIKYGIYPYERSSIRNLSSKYFNVKVANRDSFMNTDGIITFYQSTGLYSVRENSYENRPVGDVDDNAVLTDLKSAISKLRQWIATFPENAYSTQIRYHNDQLTVNDVQTFLDLMEVILTKISECSNSRILQGVSIDAWKAFVQDMTPESYATDKPLLDAAIAQMKGSFTYDLGTKYADGVSIYDAQTASLPLSYDASAYVAGALGITAAPSMSLFRAKNMTELNNALYSWNFVSQCTSAIQSYDYAYLSTEKYNEYKKINYSESQQAIIPVVRLFPTSSSEDDNVTYNASSYATSISLNQSSEQYDKIFQGQLYVSSYQIFEFLKEKFNISLNEIIDTEVLESYYTQIPDVIINENGSSWWYDINENVSIKTPKSKTMFDWLLMFCNTHSLSLSVLNNELKFAKYASQTLERKIDQNMFNLRTESVNWLACGDLETQTFYIDFSSSEEGADIHINEKSPIRIYNKALKDTSSVLYTNGAHRILFSSLDSNVSNAIYRVVKTSGSNNFVYIKVNLVDNGSELVETNLAIDYVVNGKTIRLSSDVENVFQPENILNTADSNKYISQVEMDASLLRAVLSPYPTIFEIEVYMDFDNVYDLIRNLSESMTLFYVKELNGWYLITAIENINSYNEKSPVKITLYKYNG